MGLYDHWPYTNFHELNLSWILRTMEELTEEVREFVSLNTIKYADPIQWDITTQYEKNTVVIDPNTGTAYISVAPVPSGVDISRADYWAVIFDLSQFVTKANENLTGRIERTPTLTATFASNAGDWLIWNEDLYNVLTNISVGDPYIVNTNIEHFTIEEIVNIILSRLGDLTNLTTTDKTNIVNAINEIVSNIGDLQDLNTTDQSSIVNAINENVTNIGDLQSLTTSDTSSLVNAINEIDGVLSALNANSIGEFARQYAGKKILIVGDSLSVPTNTWAETFATVAAAYGCTVNNLSVGGYTTAQALVAVNALSEPYDLALVWLGVNDANNSTSIGTVGQSGTFINNMYAIFNKIFTLNTSTKVFAFSSPYAINITLAKAKSTFYYNAALLQLCKLYGVAFKDIADICNDSFYNQSAMQADGVHFKVDVSKTMVFDVILNKILIAASDTYHQYIDLDSNTITPASGVTIVTARGFCQIGDFVHFNTQFSVTGTISAGGTLFTFPDEMGGTYQNNVAIINKSTHEVVLGWISLNGNVTTDGALSAGTYVIDMLYSIRNGAKIPFTS